MVTPEEAMWFIGGSGIQTEGEMEESCPESDTFDIIGLILVGVLVIGIYIYFKFFL